MYFTSDPHTRPSVFSLLVAAALIGCTDARPDAPDDWADPSTGESPKEIGGRTVGEFVARISPREGRVEIRRINAGRMGLLQPQSQVDLSAEEDGVSGSNPVGTVELVTNSIAENLDCPSQQLGRFCGSVTLRHFYSGRSFNNVYVQVTKITDVDRTPMVGHQGSNSSPALSWPGNYALSNSLGLWSYGSLGASAPSNESTMTWEFLNPDDADTYIALRVVASPSYTTYTRQASSATFIDACTAPGGVTLGQPGTTYKTLPAIFPFSIFGITDPTIKVARGGQIVIGPGVPIDSGNNPSFSLTSTSAPYSGIFPYWDKLTYTTTITSSKVSNLCYLVVGSAPNRQILVTWKAMKIFGQLSTQYDMTFDAILSEGSDRIDFVYYNMTTTNLTPQFNQARINGSRAVIGLQNETGTVAVDGAVGGLSVNSGVTCSAGGSCQSFAYVPVY